MGCFDTLVVTCPRCPNKIKFQSKAGLCSLDTYDINDCPPVILDDLNGEYQKCNYCGHYVTIRVQTIAKVE